MDYVARTVTYQASKKITGQKTGTKERERRETERERGEVVREGGKTREGCGGRWELENTQGGERSKRDDIGEYKGRL